MTIAALKADVAEPTVAPGSADVAVLVAAKLRCVASMIAVYLTVYLGLSILCGFAKPLLATKMPGPVNLGFALIVLNYLVAWVLAVSTRGSRAGAMTRSSIGLWREEITTA